MENITVHLLFNGKPVCGFSKYAPPVLYKGKPVSELSKLARKDWSDEHKYVGQESVGKVNCGACASFRVDKQEPEIQVDHKVLDEEFGKSTWVFCGKFPLKEISEGRRACRRDWRARLGHFVDVCMFCVERKQDSNDENESSLVFVEESSDETSIFLSGHDFTSIEDMLSEDWFLEEEKDI